MKARRLRKNHAYNVIDYLKSNEYASAEDISHEFQLHYKIAERHLKECWALDLVYIRTWDRKYHHWVPVYKWGNKPDAEKPRPLTKQEVEERYKPKRNRWNTSVGADTEGSGSMVATSAKRTGCGDGPLKTTSGMSLAQASNGTT
jgi:hypothetical protein